MKNYHKNPRQIKDKQFRDLRAWLAELGDLSGIVHDLNTDEVISGNQRMRAIDIARCEIVLTEGPHDPDAQGTVAHGYVLWQGAKYNYRQVRWTAEQCEKANIVANKAGGTWDFDILANEWEKDDLLEWGFELEELGMLPDDETPDDPGPQIDRAEELREKWGVVAGQLWQLGEHRLICGDCTDAAVVARVMGGERAQLAPVDPPYNVNKSYDGATVDDTKTSESYETFSRGWFGLCQSVSNIQIVTPGCINLTAWARLFDAYHIAPWTKSNSLTNGKVARWWCWEPIFFFGDKWKRSRSNDIFDYPIGQQKDTANHPCPKPLPMWEDLITNYSEPGDVIYEAFSGSGTTLIACERLGRRACAIEISPAYCAVAIQRWVDMTGGTPELVVNSAETVQNAT